MGGKLTYVVFVCMFICFLLLLHRFLRFPTGKPPTLGSRVQGFLDLRQVTGLGCASYSKANDFQAAQEKKTQKETKQNLNK